MELFGLAASLERSKAQTLGAPMALFLGQQTAGDEQGLRLTSLSLLPWDPLI